MGRHKMYPEEFSREGFRRVTATDKTRTNVAGNLWKNDGQQHISESSSSEVKSSDLGKQSQSQRGSNPCLHLERVVS